LIIILLIIIVIVIEVKESYKKDELNS